MSTEHLVYDVEKGSNVIVVRDPPRKESHWKCLSICSFLLLIGAVTIFTLLQFGAFGPSANQDAKGNGNPFPEGMPQTLQVRSGSSGKPAVHAIASRTHSNNLIWTTKLEPAMAQNGMRLDEKENVIVVPSSGLYFVYSQLLFHGENCREHTQGSLLLTHTIFRKSNVFSGDEVELMKAVKSVCEEENITEGHNKLWFESIYQGGVFRLQQGDKLKSSTTTAGYLNLEREGQIYFGAIALD